MDNDLEAEIKSLKEDLARVTARLEATEQDNRAIMYGLLRAQADNDGLRQDIADLKADA